MCHSTSTDRAFMLCSACLKVGPMTAETNEAAAAVLFFFNFFSFFFPSHSLLTHSPKNDPVLATHYGSIEL